MKRTLLAPGLALSMALAALAPVHAGEGHDHGDACFSMWQVDGCDSATLSGSSDVAVTPRVSVAKAP